MSAFFFGPSGRQLFGCYHAPTGTARGAAVICPSWGAEYQFAHRALRVAAKRLAERGVHVLRFDYSGTGDSWGDGTDASLTAWQADVSFAIDELRAMAGTPTVDLLGLRMGALIAARAAAQRADVRRTLLWDPIANGVEWVRGVRGVRSDVPTTTAPDAAVEFGQRLVSAALLHEFESIGPASYPASLNGSALVLRTTPESGGILAGVERRSVEDVSPWLEDPSIWSGLVPVKAIAAITEWMT